MVPPPHASFAAALRDPSRSFPAPEARFAAYRSNRMTALTESLAATFGATERIVGSDFFRAMAQAFIDRHPPRSAVLHEYGAALPRFIETFQPAGTLPYLADIARIEWAWMCAYHATDAAPLDSSALGAFPGEALLALPARLHPSAQLIRSHHPAGTIWQMNTEGGTPAPIADWHGQAVLVLRPHRHVLVRIISAETAAFLGALAGGLTLGEAAETGFAAAQDFDLATQLAGAFSLGLIAGLYLPPRKDTPT